ncbi:MAG: choice-of-anchor Q domain-containing protein [Weeksellaceae bacterium]
MKMNYLFTFLILLFALNSTHAQISPNSDNLLYVNKNVSGGDGSGDSWANAVPELRTALSWADSNSNQWTDNNTLQIWVAQGEYQPLSSQSFKMLNHVEIYGGFNGTESELEERDWEIHPTVLKGNNNSVIRNDYTNNNKLTKSAVLDGFTITDGNTDYGGGIHNMFASPTLTHLVIRNNTTTKDGGGMYNSFYSSPILTDVLFHNNTAIGLGGGIIFGNNSSPILNHVIIRDNTANRGGGLYNSNSSAVLTNVLIHNNTANHSGGGVFINGDSSAVLTNVLIHNNTAAENGGGIVINGNLSPILTNVTISNNKANEGSGIYITEPTSYSVKIYNSIIHGNTNLDGSSTNNIITASNTKPMIFNSLIQGASWNSSNWGNNDNSNIVSNTNPFINSANANFNLTDISQAIDSGKNTYYTDADKGNGDLTNDLDLSGNPRLNGPNIDMGAYEYIGLKPSVNNILYVNKNVNGGNGTGDSWENAVPELRDALNWTQSYQSEWTTNNTLQIWVAQGEYQPKAGQFFKMCNHVQIYGGFNATETTLEERDWDTHPTILKGNGRNVVHNAHSSNNRLTNTAVLDGFTITDGNFQGGGGLGGGGIHNVYASPTLTHLIIRNNKASGFGGGMLNRNSSPVLNHVIISENTAANGGGMYIESNSYPILTNVLIHNNTTHENGGGICIHDSRVILTNVTISGNRAPSLGSGIHIDNSLVKIYNSIIWGNLRPNGNPFPNIVTMGTKPNIHNSLIQGDSWDFPNWGDYDGTNIVSNANTNPFTDSANGDYTLAENSLAINEGKNTYYTDADKGNGDLDNDLDLAGYLRLSGETIDMGAYEFQTCEDISFENDTVSICEEPFRLLSASSTDTEYEYTWSPFTGLYLDEALSQPYDGEVSQHVYASPTTTTTYSVHAYSPRRGCELEKSMTVNKLDNHWLGATSNNWNSIENWSLNQIPTNTHCVKINDTDNVIIGLDIHAHAKNLWIGENGGLDIRNGGSLTVKEYIHTYAGEETNRRFLVRQGGNLIQVDNSAQNIGKIAVQKVITLSPDRKQYNFISSPIIHTHSIKQFLYPENDPNAILIEYNELTDFFVYSIGNYIPGKGYAFKEKLYALNLDRPLFKGEIPNGTIHYPLVQNSQGFNLVGNPYPSNIDLQSVYLYNQLNISGSFYFWDNRGNTLFEQHGPDYHGNHYAIYNGANNTGSAAPFKATTEKTPNRYATVGSAFLVKANKPIDFRIRNSDRTKNPGVEFFGGDDVPPPINPIPFAEDNFTHEEEMDRYWLTLKTPSELSVMNAVVYFDEGDNAFSNDDSESLGGSDDIFTLVGENKLTIQGKAPFVKTDVVPLGVRLFDMGTYVISLYDKEGVFANGQNIYIRDRKLKTVYNLSQADYKFIGEAGEITDRFQLIYMPYQLTASSLAATASELRIEKKDNHIVVTSTEDKITQIEVFGLNGFSTFQKSGINNLEYKIPVNQFEKQIIVFVVETETGEVITKKFVNK